MKPQNDKTYSRVELIPLTTARCSQHFQTLSLHGPSRHHPFARISPFHPTRGGNAHGLWLAITQNQSHPCKGFHHDMQAKITLTGMLWLRTPLSTDQNYPKVLVVSLRLQTELPPCPKSCFFIGLCGILLMDYFHIACISFSLGDFSQVLLGVDMPYVETDICWPVKFYSRASHDGKEWMPEHHYVESFRDMLVKKYICWKCSITWTRALSKVQAVGVKELCVRATLATHTTPRQEKATLQDSWRTALANCSPCAHASVVMFKWLCYGHRGRFI